MINKPSQAKDLDWVLLRSVSSSNEVTESNESLPSPTLIVIVRLNPTLLDDGI